MSDTIINPMDIYWIGTLDAVDIFSLVLAVLNGLAFVGLVCGVIYNADMMTRCDNNNRYYGICKAWAIVCGILFLVFAMAAIFIPGKTTMIEMMIAKYATHENVKLTTDSIKEIVDYIINAMATLK